MKISYSAAGQALAPPTQQIPQTAFAPMDGTEIRWLGGGGAMLNSRGTVLMIDPLLEGFDMPLLIEMPILPQEIPHLDAVLVTHIDNDHFSRPTCRDVKSVCKAYHAPHYVAGEMQKEGLSASGHDIRETFSVGEVRISLTPALHNWQNEVPEFQYRQWMPEDYCGYLLETPDGRIWMPGDSRLLEEQLHLPQPDVILFDFSDNEWHITFEGAVRLANAYPDADLICIHWGSVDAPKMTPFNGNPERLLARVTNPERIKVLAPGEAYRLQR